MERNLSMGPCTFRTTDELVERSCISIDDRAVTIVTEAPPAQLGQNGVGRTKRRSVYESSYRGVKYER